MKKIFLTVLLVSLIAITACDSGVKEVNIESDVYHQTMDKLSEIIVHDIFSPPVASRIYAYPSIAMYETLAKNDPTYKSLAGQLNELTPIPDPKGEVSYDLAALQAFIKIGRTLIFSESDMDDYRDELYEKLSKGVNSEFFEASLAYGDEVAAHILKWADGDMYKQTRTYPKFTVTNDPTRWQPTPPGYFEAIEPHWTQIRPFAIDSASQFTPERPTEFSTDKNSQFYKETMEVYNTGVNLGL